MKISHRTLITGLAATGAASPAAAATADISIAIPQLKVAEYHRPYVAVWLEPAAGTSAKTLAVWYDADNREDAGQKWLRDLRAWWRKGGRTLKMPANGISGATRAPGPQRARFNLGALQPGAYRIVVEAAREEGGREVVTLPFTWNGKGARASASGSTELGAVAAVIRP